MTGHAIGRMCLPLLLLVVGLGTPGGSAAHSTAHVHGVARVDVAVDGKGLMVRIESPLDNLLGFEHRPRTPAQQKAADALLEQLNQAAALVRLPAAAACKPQAVVIDAGPINPGAATPRDGVHADLQATYEFACEHPERLVVLELGLFELFKRIQKIEVQVAGAKAQSRQTLRRPDRAVRLAR